MTLLFLLIIILIFLILIFLALNYFPTNHMNFHLRTIIAMSRLPGPRGLPFFIGIACQLVKLEIYEYIPQGLQYHKKYPRICAFWAFGVPIVLVFDPDDLELIMGNTRNIEKGYEYSVLQPWLQEGLLISGGKKWHQRRKLLTPAFHFKILEDGLITLNKHARLLLNNMLKHNGKPFIAESLITLCTLDTICETAMGYSLNLQQDQNEFHYFKALQSVCEKTLTRMFKGPFSTRLLLYKMIKNGKEYFKDLSYVHGLTSKIIKERKEACVKEQIKKTDSDDCYQSKKKKAFLDILIEMEHKVGSLTTDKDIQEEVDTFMFEGHDTTKNALIFSLYLLGKHPLTQDKVHEEVHSIFGDSDRDVTTKDLNKMQYLEMVIKETLRMYPSVFHFSRKTTEDIVLSGNVIIPKGVNLGITPFLIHRNSKHFPNPEEFDPERFTYENCKARHPYAYIPFSAGPRNCIGQKFAMMELKTILSTIIRYTKVYSLSEVNNDNLKPLITLETMEPVVIAVKPRLFDTSDVFA